MNTVNSFPTSPTLESQQAPAKLRQVAQDFEAVLIGSLLRSLEQSFGDLGGPSSLAGAPDYQYLGTEALSSVIAKRGSLGIADTIVRNLWKPNQKASVEESP
jgi:Rod binding domain-containing protein